MKKFKIYTVLLFLFAGIFISCEEESKRISFDSDVLIHEFSINGIEAEINEENKTISVDVPEGTDLTSLVPTILIDQSAETRPSLDSALDFTNPVTVMVVNGDLYSEYVIQVSYIDLTISSFIINGTRGLVNNDLNTISVVLPDGTDVTNLSPEIVIDDTASVSPVSGEAVDFTNAVTYTVENQGFTKSYEVTVEIQELYIGFLGAHPNASSITEDDELAAAEWFFDNYEDGRYVSFDDIKNGNVDLSEFKVLWWYHDATEDLPAISLDADVLISMKNFHKNGGNLLLNSHAVSYLWSLDRITNNYARVRGSGDGWDLNGTWYVGVTIGGNLTAYDKSNHPVYDGLTTEVQGNGDVWIPLTSPGWVEDHNHVIVEIAPFHGYGYDKHETYNAFQNANNVEWLGVWAGNRDYYMAGVMEFLPTNNFAGRSIYQGIGAFEFNKNAQGNLNPDGVNLYQSNIEMFTKNALDYLFLN